LFWALILAAGTMLWRSWKRSGLTEDGVLLASWLLTLTAFLLVAGPRAMSPGNERFAICLIAPTVILVSRAFALAWSWNTPAGRIMLPAAVILGWFMLADYHSNYFRFIEKTGGQAHLTFRTAAEEPKAAALKYILENRMSGETMIVCGRWWNLCPLKYLGMSASNLRVLTPDEAEKTEEYRAMKREGRVWFVEFSGSEELHKIETQLAGLKTDRHEIDDYGGRSILTVLHPQNGLEFGIMHGGN
jgi:hypothetical protein